MSRTKSWIKDLTPPVVLRSASKLRGRGSSAPTREEVRRTVLESEASPEWYDESFEDADHWRAHYSTSPWYYIWTVIVDRIQGVDSPSVLDIGCGPGQLASFLRDRGITDYVGLDFSSKRVEWARSAVPELRFEVADAYTTDLFESVSYNTVICTEFLEHVDRDLDVVSRVRKGTRFIGTVPDFGGGSHVRYFSSAEEVSGRYGDLVSDLRVDTFHMPWPGMRQFLLDGITK